MKSLRENCFPESDSHSDSPGTGPVGDDHGTASGKGRDR